MAASAQRKPGLESGNVAVLRFQGTDAQLLELVRREDPSVPAVVYDRYGDDVNRLIWRCLGADAEHDDIVHDAFIQILRGLGRVQDPSSLRSWIASVALNTARSELRRRRRRRAFWSADAPPEVEVSGGDPEARDLLRRVYAILDRFPPDERIAFVLRHVEQRALAEVAELVGCSLATIKRRLARATRRFRTLTAKEPDLAERLSSSSWGGGT